jgi:hypothetical protein
MSASLRQRQAIEIAGRMGMSGFGWITYSMQCPQNVLVHATAERRLESLCKSATRRDIGNLKSPTFPTKV